MEFAVFNRRIYTGTVSILPYPSRLAWGIVLFEGEKLRGKVKLPVYDLARWAAITVTEAAAALQQFQEPDEHSSSKVDDGRRLRRIDGEEDWYEIINWDKHLEERQVFFNRLRQQRFKSKRQQVTLGNAGNAEKRSVTKEPEPELEPEPEESQRLKSASVSKGKTDSVHPDLEAAARFWNETIAPNWGKSKVQPATLPKLAGKYASLRKAMLREYPEWSLEAELRTVHRTLPKLRGASWFTFRDGLFSHNYLEKNERLWTGFYRSMYADEQAAAPRPQKVIQTIEAPEE